MTRLLCILAPALALADPGLTGFARVRTATGGIGAPIAGVEITFIREFTGAKSTVTTGVNGGYSIGLPQARYYSIARHASYRDESSAPGFHVVTGPNRQTSNVFLREPAVTTVLVVRHAEKQNEASTDPNEPLSTAGQARAQRLKDTLFRAGVSAVFSTDTVRTRSTVRPLADAFGMTTQIYSNPATLATQILGNHAGDVVLVAAHSNTVAEVANALGASVPTASINEYDNLYIVSRAGAVANVVNLQYGNASAPDSTKNSGTATTFLLTGRTGPAPLPDRLVQTGRKSGLGVIRREGTAPLVAPLATALGLAPIAFTAAQIPPTVDAILAGTQRVALMATATPTSIRAVVNHLSATPVPIVYTTDRDHLVVVTRFPSGATRVLPLRF